MPKYDYVCQKCSFVFEVTKGMKDPPPSKCPECKCSKIERFFTPQDAVGILYKGRPIWTYKDSMKYKTCSVGNGPKMKLDPSKHGDLGSWHCQPEPIKGKKKK